MNFEYLDKFKPSWSVKTHHIFNKYIPHFRNYIVSNYKNRNSRTIYLDIKTIEMFDKFMYYAFDEVLIEDVNNFHIEEFKLFCYEGLKNNNKTINAKLKSLNLFFNYLTDIWHIYEYNPLFKVKKLRNEAEKKPTILNSSDLKILFENMRKLNGIRDIVLSKLILQTGSLISDILNIKLSDIDISSKVVTFIDDDGFVKEFPLSDSLLIDLKEYLAERTNYPSIIGDSKYLFLSSLGHKYNIRNFQLFFKEALIKSDLPLTISPRHLRSTALYNFSKIVEEDKLKEISGQVKVKQYYELKYNPLNAII
ncbi:MAG: tyrosine-type recombinase/integrase [Candidatus Woesearchaeota archaeon]